MKTLGSICVGPSKQCAFTNTKASLQIGIYTPKLEGNFLYASKTIKL